MSDIYRIAVRLTMESNAAGVLSALSQQLLHVHADVRRLEGGLRSLDRVKLAVFGGISIAAGAGLLGMLKTTLDASKELNRQLTTTRTLASDPGKSAALAAQALNVARSTSNSVRGVPLEKAVELFNDSYSIMGAGNAAKVNSILSRYAMVSGGSSGDYEKSFDNLRELIKSGELSGQIIDKKTHEVNTDRLMGYIDLASKASAATDNRINARTFFQIAQQGGTALNNMTPDGIMGVLMAAQDMGGFRAGTATMSAFSQFVGGVMTQPKAKRLHELGLVGDYKVGKGGHLDFEKGALDTGFTKALRKDPLEAVKILRDALTKHGVTGEKQSEEMFKILGRQTVQRLFSDWLNSYQQKVDERGRIMGAQGTKQQDDTRNDKDYERNAHNLEVAIHNLKAELGNSMTPAAVDVLKRMTDGVRYLNDQVVKMGPEKIGAIGKGIAVLGASLVGAGGLALVAALGPAGWLALGVGALATAFAAFAPKQFDEWLGGLLRLMHGIGTFNFKEIVEGVGQEFTAAFHLLPDQVQASITAAIGRIGKFISDAFSRWAPQFKPASPTGEGDNIGALPQAYHGNGFGNSGLLINAAYTGGGAGGGPRVMASAINGGITNSNVVIMGGAGGGLGGGGSFVGGGGGSWNGRALAIGGGAGVGHTASKTERAAFIRSYAASIGIDPTTALRVAQSEGFNVFTGDHGTSFGDFQMHVGGGLGDRLRRMGIDPSDPRNWRASDKFALDTARREGWGAWHGAARVGIGNHQGIGRPPVPAPRDHRPIVIEHKSVLDGKVLARSTTRYLVAEMRRPNSIGRFDDHSMAMAAGATTFGA